MSPRQYPAKKGTSADKMANLPHFADGGFIGGMRARMFGPAETVTQKYARQDAERAAKAPAPTPVPAAAPAPSPAAGLGMISNYAGMTAMQRREKEAGMKDGGAVVGPGTGTSDSVPIMASHGEYMLPADTTKALGGKKVLDKIVDATHTPTGKPAIKRGMMARADGGMVDPIKSNSFGDASASTSNPGTSVVSSAPMAPPAPAPAPSMASPPAMSTNAAAMGSTPAPSSGGGRPVQIVSAMEYRPMMAMPAMRDGGAVDEALKKKNSFGDAAAAMTSPAVAQIPVGGMRRAPAADGSQSNPLNSEIGRNAVNTLSALPGVGGMGARGLAAGSELVPAASTFAGGMARRAGPGGLYLPLGVAGGAALAATKPPATEFSPEAPAASTTDKLSAPPLGMSRSPAASGLASPKPAAPAGSNGAGPNIGMNSGPMLNGQSGTAVDGAPGVSKFKTADGRTLYSNVTGPDNDKLMSDKPGVSTVPGMSRQEIDRTLGGLSASQVSSENAIRAANLRDGVDINRGTAAGQAADAQQRMQALASSPLGTPGRKFAQEQLIASMGDATARRGQDASTQIAEGRLSAERVNTGIAQRKLGLEEGKAATEQAQKDRVAKLDDLIINGNAMQQKMAAGKKAAILGKGFDGGNKPLTDTQGKALLFGSRMKAAGEILDQMAGEGVDMPSVAKRAADKVGAGAAVNWTQSPQQQKVEQAQRDFINAVLRRESGAVISDPEFANAREQYFPQIGDNEETKAQKRENRMLAMNGILAEVPDAEARVAQVRGTNGAAAKASTSEQRTVTRSGMINGRKVNQYSDGSTDYAN